MTKVSVIIPTYNSEKSIARCIDSILGQTYKETEIIVIDDGSSDETKKVLDGYSGLIKIIINSKNLGISASRNIGLEKASGDYIMFCDSDDTFEKDAIESLVEEAKCKKVDIIRSNVNIVNKTGSIKQNMHELSGKTIKYSDAKQIIDRLFFIEGRMPCFVMALFIKKKLLLDFSIRFDENLSMMEDTVFYGKLFATNEEVLFFDRATYNYYINDNSVTHSPSMYERNLARIVDANQKLSEVIGDNTDINNKHFKICFSYIAKYYCEYGKAPRMDVINPLLRKVEFGRRERMWRMLYSAVINNKWYLPALLSLYNYRKKVTKNE